MARIPTRIFHPCLVSIGHFPFLWKSMDIRLISDPWSINATIGSFTSRSKPGFLTFLLPSAALCSGFPQAHPLWLPHRAALPSPRLASLVLVDLRATSFLRDPQFHHRTLFLLCLALPLVVVLCDYRGFAPLGPFIGPSFSLFPSLTGSSEPCPFPCLEILSERYRSSWARYGCHTTPKGQLH